MRLPEWPQYCQHLSAIPHIGQVQPPISPYLEAVLAGRPLPATPPTTLAAAGDVPGLDLKAPGGAGPPGVSQQSSAGGAPPGVLDGIKVVEFAQNAAIPHCGRLLAGLGADVVKVEPPTGDAMRLVAPLEGEGRAYVLINPGKRSIALDLTSPDAPKVVDALFAWADVVLVAFKLPDLERYGLHWEHARTVNPRLVYLVHTALGPEGPDADQGGYDGLVQGRSGLGWVMNRSGGSAPQPTRPAINDFSTGFVSAFAVMAGLRHRDQTGEGQRLDTSLLGTAMSLATPTSIWFPSDADVLAELDEELLAMRLAGLDFDTQRAHYESRVEPAKGAFQLYFRHYLHLMKILS